VSEHVGFQCFIRVSVSQFFVNGATHELLTRICTELGEFGKVVKIKKPENQRFASLALLWILFPAEREGFDIKAMYLHT
jgi:hypothetical protein